MWTLVRFVSWPRFRRGLGRRLLVWAGIAAGVASLVATGAANSAILKGFRGTIAAVAGEAELEIAGATAGLVDEAAIERVRQVPGVKSASPAVTEVAKLPDGTQLYVIGADLAAGDDTRGFNAFGGGDLPDPVEFLNDPDAVLVARRFATARGLKVGDRFELRTTRGRKSLHVRGLLDDSGAAKAFGGSVAVMDLYSAQAAFGRGARVDRIDVRLHDGYTPEAMIGPISAVIGAGPSVGRPQRRNASIELMLRSFQVGLYMGSAVSLLVGLFLVFNAVSFSVTQRRREIGTLRALGVTRAGITWLFAFESLLDGVVGSLAGLGLGALLARWTVQSSLHAVNTAYLPVNVDDAGVTLEVALAGLVMGIVGSVAASLLPALEGARVPPVEALRRDRATRGDRRPTWARRLFGPALVLSAFGLLRLPLVEGVPIFGNLALAVIALGAALSAADVVALLVRAVRRPVSRLFRGPGRIAIAGLAASRRRGGVAAGAVLVGLALVLCLATFVQSFRGAMLTWIDRAVPADLFVTSGTTTIGLTNTPLDEALGAEIRAVPGVGALNELRLKWLDALDLHLALYGIGWEEYAKQVDPPFVEGDEATAGAGLAKGGVLISDNLARRRDLHLGDTIELPTPAGPRRFGIVGTIVDYSSDQGVVLLERAFLKEIYDDGLVDSFNVYLAPGAELGAVRAEIERRLGSKIDLTIASNAELRAEVLALIDDFFALVYVLLFIAVAVSVLGVAGTLLSQVVDRTRELGILRAVGASRGQIVGAVALEAALLGLAGALLGLPAGLAMGKVFVDVVGVQATGWLFPTLFPLGFGLLAALGAIGFSAAGGLLPARRAAGLDVVEAISYE